MVGAGYWGPNLARNFRSSPDWDLAAICDIDRERAQRVADLVGGVRVVTSLDDLLADDDLDAVADRDAGAHPPRRRAAGAARRQARRGREAARRQRRTRPGHAAARPSAQGLVLMADHTYCYTPAALKIRELIQEGALGDILFVDSVRINLGLVQPDVDVFWDLAPHDLSIIDFVLPGGLRPVSVSRAGRRSARNAARRASATSPSRSPSGAIAHVHVNWLSPTKIRQMVIGGTKRTLVWDDLNPQQRRQRLRPRRRPRTASRSAARTARASTISYRLGDTWSPALPEREALRPMASEFAAEHP